MPAATESGVREVANVSGVMEASSLSAPSAVLGEREKLCAWEVAEAGEGELGWRLLLDMVIPLVMRQWLLLVLLRGMGRGVEGAYDHHSVVPFACVTPLSWTDGYLVKGTEATLFHPTLSVQRLCCSIGPSPPVFRETGERDCDDVAEPLFLPSPDTPSLSFS